ncbi:ComF family protein [Mariniflexile ostreae]|uniref:ComF family protein n=1 Tax=Mariniflexile ostreae TaxID=1520892 RepID=A0ABV5F7N3_9FLAO
MLNLLLNLFFPKVCYACHNTLKDNEKDLCISCRHSIPVTNFHFNNDDTVLKIFYGRVKIEQATALLRFEKKGLVQHLIHQLKYKGHETIGMFLGDWLGGELATLNHYEDIDLVIPVPIHKKKLRKRGYNQVTKFGQQIATALHAEYKEDVLLKISNTSSQTLKTRWFRWQDNTELFLLNHAKDLENKHILLVDDLITTGATMEACITVLQQVPSVKISVASMAIA